MSRVAVERTAAVCAWVTCISLVVACGTKRDDGMGGGSAAYDGGIGVSSSGGSGGDGGGSGGGGGDGGVKLDVANGGTGGVPCEEGGDCNNDCTEVAHKPCDSNTTDVFEAMGLNCPGEATVTASVDGSLQAIGIRSSFGTAGQWPPREGSVYGVIGSGFVADLDMVTPPGDNDAGPTNCNDDLGGQYDKGLNLPAPIMTTNVTGDCTADPTVLGTGDCSNTIQGQFSQGGSANDYTEVRIEATVPASNNSLSYDFAFFTVEYPFYKDTGFNDMFIGWLESESWTGNISFDDQGNPISLNAGFLDFRDDGGTMAPELHGTCMQQHAGTKWLSSTAPVTPGEDITLVLAIFDLSDSILDSYAFLDNFGWGCDGTGSPTTVPVG